MFYGEHLSAEEEPPTCRTCGKIASYEVFDAQDVSCGGYCQRCGKKKLKELKLYVRLAKAIVRKGKTP